MPLSRRTLAAAVLVIGLPTLAAAQQPSLQPPATVAKDTTNRQALLGTYELAPGRNLIITLEKDTLFGTSRTGDRKQLTHQSGTTFAVEGTAMMVTFNAAPDGKIKELVMRQGGDERVLRKLP